MKNKFEEKLEEENDVVDECQCDCCECEEAEQECDCLNGGHCQCGEDCHCEGDCDCGDECHCGDGCECEDKEHECHCEHEHNKHCTDEHHSHHKHHKDEGCCHGHCDCEGDVFKNGEAGQYLQMAQRLQADFDNYRKHVAEQLNIQREEGKKSVIEVFLPCLDTFKEAKKSISDENVLSGVNMIENKIMTALKSLGVEKTETIGQRFDHNLHEVIAVFKDESKENDIILEEYQAGYTMNGKVIRYSKVIVNKLD